MIAVPAIDLREGACVQLVGGSYAAERVRLADPALVARRWADAGFARLHVVDLDAATGRGDNAAVLRSLLADAATATQVGGGVRDQAGIDTWLAGGAARVIVGTRAILDPDWLAGAAQRHPGRLVVAADVRAGRVVTHGWTVTQPWTLEAFLAGLDPVPLAGVLVTAIDREGRLEGADAGLIARAAQSTRHPVFASGGISTRHDLEALAHAGAAEAVIGMALYTGALDARAIAQEFDR
jgi:phosphoribosylformimino-5-aminoimidazole carboxamide ribotide isomerase